MWLFCFFGFIFLQYAIQRATFDECANQTPHILQAPTLSLLSRRLIFFYRQSVDANRLVRGQLLWDSSSFVSWLQCFSFFLGGGCVLLQIWLCQNLVKHNAQFVELLVGPHRQTCMFQIKRILGFCCRYLSSVILTSRVWISALAVFLKINLQLYDIPLFKSVFRLDSFRTAATTA